MIEAVKVDLSRFWIAFGLFMGAQLILRFSPYAFTPMEYILLAMAFLIEYHPLQGDYSRVVLASLHLFAHAAVFWAAIYTFAAPKAKGTALIRSNAPESKRLHGWVYRVLAGGLTIGVLGVIVEWLFCSLDICVSTWARVGLLGVFGFYLVAIALWILALFALAWLLVRLAKWAALRVRGKQNRTRPS